VTSFELELDDTGLREALDDLKETGTSDRVEVVGTTVEYGVYLEIGTEDMPPYPWFRPAVREFRANPESFIIDNTGYTSVEEIPSADALVTAIAQALVNQMEHNVSAASSSDRSPGTHPEHPKRDTGTLVNSIQAVRTSE